MPAVAKELKRFKPLALPPRPQTPKRPTSPARLHQYENAAKVIGFEPVQLICAQLLNFFAEEHIELYPYKKVDDWLTMKKEWAIRKGRSYWHWRPLRSQDIVTYLWLFDSYTPLDGCYCPPSQKEWHSNEAHACRPYEKLVPAHALEKVARIEGRFGNKIAFFVSDYAVIDPDPFIMVRPRERGDGPVSRQTFIFDFWDEPGFGNEPIELKALPAPNTHNT